MTITEISKYEIEPTRIRIARAIKGLTVTALEKESGVSKKTISKIENAKTKNMRYETFKKLINALDQPIDFFVKKNCLDKVI